MDEKITDPNAQMDRICQDTLALIKGLQADFRRMLDESADHQVYLATAFEEARLHHRLEDTETAVEALQNNWRETPRVGLEAVMAASALQAAVDLFDANISAGYIPQRAQRVGQHIKQSAQKTWKRIKKIIKKKVASISSNLGQALARLPTLQNWSLGGEIGLTLALFQGNASLQLTFGP